MSKAQKKIRINRIYRHPKTGAIVVHFEFPELNYRNNMNFNSQQFIGYTKKQIKETIMRALEDHYEQKKRESSTFKKAVATTMLEMEGLEI